MKKYVDALKLAKEYVKDPRKFSLQTDYHSYINGYHEDICFPYRLLAEDEFKSVCPYHHTKEFDKPERSNCCYWCRYFGTIKIAMNKGKKRITFDAHKSIVDIFEEINENV